MAGRNAYTPTDKDIETVQKMKEKGATDASCADALGISRNTFGNYKNVFFGQCIKNAHENRAANLLSLAKDALALRLQQRTVEEVTTNTRTYEGVEQVDTKVVEKVIQPADTLIMFTLVNRCENGEWKSINKVEQVNNNINTPALKIEWTE